MILYPEAAQALHGTEQNETFARDLRTLGLEMEVVTVDRGSSCVGRTIEAIEHAAGGAFLIVGLERREGKSLVRPEAATTLQAGDGVVILGRPGRARTIATIFEGGLRRSAR
jgi:Trk K+ transport system NAD-binding subunit